MEEEAVTTVWEDWDLWRDLFLVGFGAVFGFLSGYVSMRIQWKKEEDRREKEFKRQKLEEAYQYLLSGSKGTINYYSSMRDTLIAKKSMFSENESETEQIDFIKFTQIIQFYFEDLKDAFKDLEGHYNILVGLCNQSLELIEKQDASVWNRKRREEIEYYHKKFADSVVNSIEILSTEMKKYI